MKATPRPTRSVTSALTRVRALFSAPDTQTHWPSLMPRSAASPVLISTNMSCWSSASQRLERVSSPPPSYSTRRPEVRMIGKSLAIVLLHRRLLDREADVRHPELAGVRQRRVLRDQIRPRRVDRLAVGRHRVRQVPGHRPRLGVAVMHDAVVEADALDAARQVGRPGHRVHLGAADPGDDGELLRGQVLVPAELLHAPPS